MDEYCKRSRQIPAFGNWDYANELPITQYFECARQAGLIRFSSSSRESNPYVAAPHDLYEADSRKHSHVLPPSRKVSRVRDEGGALKEQKKGGRVCDVTEPPSKYPHHHRVSLSNNNYNHNTTRKSKQLQYGDVGHNPKRVSVGPPPKPVDEDLYKIPPELLHSSKRKKRTGFLSCLVPACAA